MAKDNDYLLMIIDRILRGDMSPGELESYKPLAKDMLELSKDPPGKKSSEITQEEFVTQGKAYTAYLMVTGRPMV